MLARVQKLSAPIKMKRKEIWALEAKAMELEKNYLSTAVENELMIDFVPMIQGGTFSSGTLKSRLEALKSSPEKKAALAELAKITSAYTARLKELAAAVEAWDKEKLVLIERSLPAIKAEIDQIPDTLERIKVVSEFDGAIVLKTQIDLVERIKRTNEDEMLAFCKVSMGVDLAAFIVKYEQNIKTFFEKFVIKDKREITEDLLASEVDKLIIALLDALKKAPGYKEPSAEALVSLKDYLRTEFLVICARDVYKETDRIQSGGLGTKANFARTATPNKVVNPYICLSMLAKQSRITEATQTLFQEWAIWTKGVYVRSLECLPPFVKSEEGGLLPFAFKYFGDSEDRDLHFAVSPLNKIAISCHHLPLAEAISSKLPVALQLVAKNEVVDQVPVAQAALVENPPVAVGGGSVVAIALPGRKQLLPLCELQRIQLSDDTRDRNTGYFAQLVFMVQKYDLHEDQSLMLGIYKKTIISNLQRYLTAKDRTTFKHMTMFAFPTNTRFTPRTNAITVNNLIDSLNEENLTAPKMIEAMYNALNELNAAASRDAAKTVREGLIEVYKFLVDRSPENLLTVALRK